MDVRSQMRRSALYYADLEAIVHGDRRLTFKQAWSRGLRLANALLGLGLKPGDRVGVLEDNSIEAADFFAGTAAAMLGFVSTGMAAIIGGLVGGAFDGSTVPLTAGSTLLGLVALLVLFATERGKLFSALD